MGWKQEKSKRSINYVTGNGEGDEMKQYRLLTDKEPFESGDEYYSSGKWRPMAETDKGNPYRENIMCPVRRLIEP